MRSILFALLTAFASSSAVAGENIMLVLDASGSMWGQIAGKTKVEIARGTVADVLGTWKADNAIGLVAYGHRRKGDCNDIETLIEPGPLDKGAFISIVNNLNAKGMTPLSAAVKHAADVLKSSERKATVILVSDGEETCNLDPCAVGAELEKSGVEFTAHVIGFDVTDPKHQAQLRCLAENTGGRYFNARNADELGAAIEGAVNASTEPPPPPATATVAAQGPMAIASEVVVVWSGPADRGDYVTFAPINTQDSSYLDYAIVPAMAISKGRGQVTLQTPAAAGPMELRYVSPIRKSSVLARVVVQIADVQASIDAPDSVPSGSMIKLTARGPVAKGHWIGFAPKGSDIRTYLKYARPSGPVSELELMTPAEPGDYELRYVLNENEKIVASQPIKVTAAVAKLDAPTSMTSREAISVRFEGPRHARHWIGFVQRGTVDYLDYSDVPLQGDTVTLRAPAEAGDYDIVFAVDGKAIARNAVTVR